MKIYTKTGDAGQTGLIGGTRVPKNHPRIAAIGDVDELNASLGFLGNQPLVREIQGWLFELGAELASPGDDRFQTLSLKEIERLEASMDEQTAELEELKNFILPGGSPEAAHLHLARSICRRAERSVLDLHEREPVREAPRVFLNRLADWLFVSARTANRVAHVEDVSWKRG